MTAFTDGAPGACRRAQIEAALADYPHLGADRLQDLLHWFKKEASALDVAMLATNQDIADNYRSFRSDHLDRLTPADILRGIAFAAVCAAIIALIVWRAL